MKNNMNEIQDNRITSVEMSVLWDTYMIESLVHHMFTYFINNVEDLKIKDMLKILIEETRDSLNILKTTFKKVKMVTPRGITSEDIKLDAPRLYSDPFYIIYTKNMAQFALTMYSLAYVQCSRNDLRELFSHYINRLVTVDKQLTEIMKTKGFYVLPPFIPLPDEVDFVKKNSFLNDFMGDKRPLTVSEIKHLFYNAKSNALGKALLMGFSQVTKSKKLKKFFDDGKEISSKYYRTLTDIIINEDITTPASYDGEVTDSTESPFSDRLMLFHVNLLIGGGFGNVGMAMSQSPRRDLSALYAKILVEVGTYADDGIKLMIKKGWLEQLPSAPDRESL